MEAQRRAIDALQDSLRKEREQNERLGETLSSLAESMFADMINLRGDVIY